MGQIQESGNSMGGVPPWLVAGGIGAAGGAGAYSAYAKFDKTQKTASGALGVATAHAGIALLGGQQASNYANTVMTSANGIIASATYSAATDTAVRTSLQNLALAVQNLSVPSYMGLATPTQPSVNSATAAPAAPTNYTGLLIAVGAYLLTKD